MSSRHGRRNGHQRRDEERREQSKERQHSTNHQVNQQKSIKERKDQLIDALTQTDLSPGTVQLLDNLVEPDWRTTNIGKAESEDIKWRIVQITKEEIEAMHPSPDSTVTGARRAYMLDDEREYLEPLTSQDKKIIETFLEGVYFGRAKAAEDGWLAELIGKSHSVSETKDHRETTDESLVSGLFS